MNRLYKILIAALFSIGLAAPAIADDIGLSFQPDNKPRIVRVDAQTVEDIGSGVLVEPKDQFNNNRLKDLIESLDGKRVKGTFRIKGKKLHKVVYSFDHGTNQLKVRVNNVNYIISELDFVDSED